jgi:hypothetical protein
MGRANYTIKNSGILKASKYNISRICFDVNFKKKIANKNRETNRNRDLSDIFKSTLDTTLNTDIIKNNTVKIGSKIVLDNFKFIMYIEYTHPDKMSVDFILNRLSSFFQSGNTLCIKRINICYSILVKK